MKIELPEHKKQVFETRFPVRWGDMDAMGHVNNAQYFRYLETARIDWMRSIGVNPAPQGQGPVIVNAFCNFYQQLSYPDEVLLKMFVSDAGRTTFETWATMERVATRANLRGRWWNGDLGRFFVAKSCAVAGLGEGAGDRLSLNIVRALLARSAASASQAGLAQMKKAA